MRLHFRPGWSAGDQAELARGPAGRMQVTELRVPSRRLLLSWAGTAWQHWWEGLSIVGLLAALAGTLYFTFRRFRQEGVIADMPVSCTCTVVVMAACLLAFVAGRYALDFLRKDPFFFTRRQESSHLPWKASRQRWVTRNQGK